MDDEREVFSILEKKPEYLNGLNYLLRLKQQNKLDLFSKEKYLEEIKGDFSSKNFKKIKKFLKKLECDEEEIIDVGPKVKEKEINYIKDKLNEYIKSNYFNIKDYTNKREKIRIYLFGSLVNGFCNNKRKPHYGRPTDENRISDVDLSIIISSDLFNSFIKSGFSTHDFGSFFGRMSTSAGEGERDFGPFNNIFNYLRNLTYASRNDRIIHIVFIEKTFFWKNHLRKEPHIKLIETWIN